jgi:hypothetical protein
MSDNSIKGEQRTRQMVALTIWVFARPAGRPPQRRQLGERIRKRLTVAARVRRNLQRTSIRPERNDTKDRIQPLVENLPEAYSLTTPPKI